ncbi:hypothetical protein EYF80_030465 [Liparis tanakae]|uniref:Uncharacterized protein n=1 Tax=Liparis tanakae TaxID=230148 RepID=A0A4Z2H0A5_9TELE|nr:hypothetical protein EYF80_030465 [Liparis tanakae]
MVAEGNKKSIKTARNRDVPSLWRGERSRGLIIPSVCLEDLFESFKLHLPVVLLNLDMDAPVAMASSSLSRSAPRRRRWRHGAAQHANVASRALRKRVFMKQ